MLDAEQQAELVGDLRRRSESRVAVELRVRRLDPDLPLPARQHGDDAGYDLVRASDAQLAPAGGRALVPTGVAVAIPPGYAGFVLPRSGLALRHGVTVLNTPGLIDARLPRRAQGDPRQHRSGRGVHGRRGDRIAQLVIQRVETPELRVVDELDDTERGLGGFGSTGV